jgi:hypothetical protein
MAKNPTPTEETLPVAGAMPEAYDYESYAGQGLEDVRQSDLSLPLIKLLQALSPETRRTDPLYLEGAAEGRWLDALRREVFDEFLFVPVRYQTRYVEWKTRKDGGGLVQDHGLDDSILRNCTSDEVGRYMTDSGHEVIPSPTFYGLVVGMIPKIGQPPIVCNNRAVVSMTGTQAKVARRWLNSITSIQIPSKTNPGSYYTPPMFAGTYKLGSIPQSNDQGAWSIPTVERVAWTDPKFIQDAVAFAKLTGEARAGNSIAQQEGKGRAATQLPPDDDIPF